MKIEGGPQRNPAATEMRKLQAAGSAATRYDRSPLSRYQGIAKPCFFLGITIGESLSLIVALQSRLF
jgi:hypothetical protein